MINSPRKKTPLLALLLVCSALAVPALAGPTDMQTLDVKTKKTGSTPSKDDMITLESRGLYTGASEGGLGKDLWKGTKRSVLIPLLEDMPVESREPVVQRLIFGALLTQTDAAMIDNDTPPEPGRDLLTVRLEKLIQAGAYKQAQDLYSSFDELEPYHENLARAGILAMMLNGEKSLGCVEAETIKPTYAESEFIKQILAFCDVTVGDTSAPESIETIKALNLKNYDLLTTKGATMPYNAQAFGALPLIERAFLAGEGKIDFEKSGVTDFKSIPAKDIRILMNSDNLSLKNRFLLTAAAEDWGLAIPGEMQDLYKAAVPPASGQDPGTMPVPSDAEGWEKIAINHTIAINAPDDESRWVAIKNGLAQSKTYGIGAVKPYAAVVAEIQPTNATEDDLANAIDVLLATGTDIPKQWSERLLQMPLGPEKNQLNQRVYALHTAARLAQKTAENGPEKEENPYPAGSRGGYLLNNIIENVDKAPPNSNNANRIYEKDYGLTYKQDYVMPSTVVWNHLLEAGQRVNTGETVILSASVLQAADLGKIYPDLLNDVRTGLNTVGLTDISSNLAIAAVLRSVQEDND